MAEPRHIIDARQFTPEFIERLFHRTRQIKGEIGPGNRGRLNHPRLYGRIMQSMFFEPSTRTRVSFETAGKLEHMHIIGSENAGEFSSRAKGESDLDNFRALALNGPDVIVVRHDKTDALPQVTAALDAEGISVPFINAGDGRGQHPTQTLLDLFTIEEEWGGLSGLNVVMVGDLAYGRTVRSLTYLLAKYPGNQLRFVAPPELQMRADILAFLDERGVGYELSDDLEAALGWADVVYQTRIQAERLECPLEELQATYDQVAGRYRIGPTELALMPPKSRVLHPLPRAEEGAQQRVKRDGESATITLVSELDPACDADLQRAAYWRQLANGLPVRMALLEQVVLG